MRAEAVILDASPDSIESPGPFTRRAYAVHPVIIIGEASSRPAQHRGPEFFERLQCRQAQAFSIGDFRIPAHPEAIVDAASEMFDEVTVNVRIDPADFAIEPDFYFGLLLHGILLLEHPLKGYVTPNRFQIIVILLRSVNIGLGAEEMA